MSRNVVKLIVAVALVAGVAACGSGGETTSADSSAVAGTESSDLAEGGSEASGGTGGSSEIVVGNISSLTGQYAICEPGDIALAMAVDSINADGGVTVDGTSYTLRLEAIDDRSESSATAAAGRDLINAGAKVIFGPCGTGSLGVLEQTRANGVIYVTANGSSAAELQNEGPHYLLTSIPSMEDRARATVQAIQENRPGLDDMVILGSDDGTVAEIVRGYSAVWEDLTGGTIDSVLYPVGESDLSSYLARVASSDPDVLYIAQNTQTVQTALGQLDAAGIDQDMVLVGHGTEPSVAADAGGRPYIAVPFTPGPLTGEGANEATAQVVADFLDRTDSEELPVYPTPIRWYRDHLYTLIAAWEAAGSFDVAAVMDQLLGQEPLYTGTLGPISFDERGFVRHPLLSTFVEPDGTEIPSLWEPS